MTFEYSLLSKFKNRESFFCVDENLNIPRIKCEIQQLTKNLSVLSNEAETKGLPELLLIESITQTLLGLPQNQFQTFFAQQKLFERLFFEDLLETVCCEIFRGKNYHNLEIVRTSDSIFSNLVTFCSRQIGEEKSVHMQILACILDKNLEFYKYNGNQTATEVAPFGIINEASPKKNEFLRNLKKNDFFDCIKRQTDIKSWNIAIFDRIEGFLVHFRFFGESTKMTESLNSISAAKFGTKSVEYEWRNSLNKGSIVDHYQFRHGWFLYVVTETYVEKNAYDESVKSVDLERLQTFVEEKANDPRNSNNKVGNNSLNMKFKDHLFKIAKIKVNSALIALKGKYSSKKDRFIDDSEDFYWTSLVDGQKYAILRPELENGPSSTLFVKYMNLFGEQGGFDYILNVILENRDCSIDMAITVFRIIQASSETLIENFIEKNGQAILKWMSDFLEHRFLENIRNFTNSQLALFLDALKGFAFRAMSRAKATRFSNNMKAKIGILGLKSDFLEKQLLGAKFIQEIYEDLVKTNDFVFLDRLASDLEMERIFDKIIKGHSSLIERGAGIFHVMLLNKQIDVNMFDLLIAQMFKSDSESRTSLINLVHNIIPDLSIHQIREFAKLIFARPDEITLEVVKLCIALQKASLDKLNDVRLSSLLNTSLWKLLERDAISSKREIIKEIQIHLIENITNENIEDYLQLILKKISNDENKTQNFSFLLKIIKRKQNLRQKISELIKKSKIVSLCIKDLTKEIEKKIQNGVKIMPSLETNNGKTSEREFRNKPKIETEETKFRRLLKFLSILIYEEGSKENGLFEFPDFCEIFASIFNHNPKIKFIDEWIMKYVSTVCNPLDLTKYKLFLEKYLKNPLAESHADFIKYFTQVFLAINSLENHFRQKTINLVCPNAFYKVTPKNVRVCMTNAKRFFGMGLIESQFLKAESPKLFRLLGNFIANIYLPYEPYDGENFAIYSEQKENLTNWALQLFKSEDLKQAEKGTILFLKIIQSEEIKTNSEIYSMSQLKEANKICINIERVGRCGTYNRIQVKVPGNFALKDLKSIIAETYKLKIDGFNLANANSVDFRPGEYIFTIDTLKLESNCLLYVKEAEFPEIKEENAYDSYRLDLTPPAKQALEEIYNRFSPNGKLTYEKLTELFSRLADRKFTEKDQIIRDLCTKMDRLKSGHIPLPNFIEYFRDMCQNKTGGISIFRQHLQTLGYNKNLKLNVLYKFIVESDFSTFTRSKISSDQKCFELLVNYIALAKAEKENSMSIEPETERSCLNLELFEKLFGLLPPTLELIITTLFEPTETLCKAKNPFILDYHFTLINALLFRPEFGRSLQYFGLVFEQDYYDAFASRIFSFNFFTVLIEKLGYLMESRNVDIIYAHGPTGFSLLLKIIKVLVGIETPEFPDNMQRILTFFNDYKRRNADRFNNSFQTGEESNRDDHRPHSNISQNATQSQKINDLILEFTINRSHEELATKINFESLNELTLSLLETINSQRLTHTASENLLLSSAVILLIGSAHLKGDAIQKMVTSTDFKRVMLDGLTSLNPLVRHYYKNMYTYLSSLFTDIKSKTEFLRILLSCIGSKNNDNFQYLMDLTLELLTEVGQMKLQNQEAASFIHKEFNFNALFVNISKILFEHRSTEEGFNQTEDHLLICYLAFLDKIIRTDEIVTVELTPLHRKQITDFLSDNCLFGIVNGKLDLSLATCKSFKSRHYAYELLKNLLKYDSVSGVAFIQNKLNLLLQNVPYFEYKPHTESCDVEFRPQGEYVGIKNLGAVCYMIATLQQFFATPTFTNAILSACDSKTSNIAIIKGRQFDDNTFHQFQILLGNLKFSKRPVFNPTDFCLSYKDFTGDPVNVTVQQDADEFLKVFLEKMENALRNSPYAGVLNSVYGGKICNLINCKSCGYKKTTEERFYNISLEVKKMTNIKESLEKLIEEETIGDYLCERCKKKGEISKRALFKKLPNVLIFSLKKTYFDLELLKNVKVHNRYEFPMEMNLKNYAYFNIDESSQRLIDGKSLNKEDCVNTESYLDPADENFEYKLVGVVIHRGNADYGHYISIINTNRVDPATHPNDIDTWYEFDDARVSSYNMDNFEDDCFGVDKSKGLGSEKLEIATSKSAYLLFYEKIKKEDLVFPIGLSNHISKSHLISNLIKEADFKFENGDFKTPYYNLKCKPSEPLRTQIENDNKILLFEEIVINSFFVTFCSDIFDNLESCLRINTEDMPIFNSLQPSPDFLKRIKGSIAIIQCLPDLVAKVFVYANRCNRIGHATNIISDCLEFLREFSESQSFRNYYYCFETLAFKFYKECIFDNLRIYFQILCVSVNEEHRNGLAFFLWKFLKLAFKFFRIETLDSNLMLADHQFPKSKICLLLQTNLNYIVDNVLTVDTNIYDAHKFDVFFLMIHQIASDNEPALKYFADMNLLLSVYQIYMSIDLRSEFAKILNSILGVMGLLIGYEEFSCDPRYQQHLMIISKMEIIEFALNDDYEGDNYQTLQNVILIFSTNNFEFSKALAYELVKTILCQRKSPIFSYFKALFTLVDIQDHYSTERLQQILGIPRLKEKFSQEISNCSFGLGPELNLKEQVFNYVSTLSCKDSILEIIYRFKDEDLVMTSLLINELVNSMNNHWNVFDYMMKLEPPDYLSSSYFCWFAAYRIYIMNQNAIFQSILKITGCDDFFDTFDEQFQLLDIKLNNIIKTQSGTDNVYPTFFADEYITENQKNKSDMISTEQIPREPLPLMRSLYIIGKTIEIKEIANKLLTKDEFGELRIICSVYKVSLAKSRPTGVSNLVFPLESITQDFEIKRSCIKDANLVDFLPELKGNKWANDLDEVEFLDLSEQTPSRKSAFLNDEYILTLESINTSSSTYILKSRISDRINKDDKTEIIFLNPPNPQKQLIATRTERELLRKINSHLSIEVAYKLGESINLKWFEDAGFSQFHKI